MEMSIKKIIGTMKGLLISLLLIEFGVCSGSTNDLWSYNSSIYPLSSSFLSTRGKCSSFIFYLMELRNTLRSYLSSYETYPYVRDIKLRVLYGDKYYCFVCKEPTLKLFNNVWLAF